MDTLRPWLTASRHIEIEIEEGGEEVDVYPAELAFDEPDLQDARLLEPPSTEYTMTKFDRHTQKMDILRRRWVNETLQKKTAIANLSSLPKDGKVSQPDGRAKFDYDKHHKETVVLLQRDKEDLDHLIANFEKKRWGHNKAISEKSSMVEKKAGNAQETVVEKKVTPTADEIGDQDVREAEFERREEKKEEMKYEESVERSRSRVGLGSWRGQNWFLVN